MPRLGEDYQLTAEADREEREPREVGGVRVAGVSSTLGKVLREVLKRTAKEAPEEARLFRRQQGEGVPDDALRGEEAAEGAVRTERVPGGETRPAPLGQTTVRTERIAEEEAEAVVEGIESRRAEGPEAMPKYAIGINLHRLSNPDQVQGVIRSVANQYAAEIDEARRGVQSHADTVALSHELGMDVETLLQRKQGEAWNAEHIFAARTLLASARDRIDELATKISAGEASKDELVQFRDALSTYSGIQAQVSGLAAEAGRALNQFKIMAQAGPMRRQQIDAMLDRFPGDQVERMADMWNALDDPLEQGHFARNMHDATVLDMVIEAWINSLLSSPATHMVNTVSNTMVAGMQIPERAVAASITGTKRLFNPKRGGVEFAEAYAQTWGLYAGMRDGFRLAYKAFIRGEPTDQAGKIEVRSHRAITGENLNKALRRGGENVNQFLRTDVVSTDELNIGGWTAWGVDALGELVRVPGRALLAEDEFFKSVGYRMQLNALAMRRAIQAGLEGDDLVNEVARLLRDPPEDLEMAAVEASHYQTFTNPVGATRSLQQFTQRMPMAKFILPFIRTPVNILKYTIERGPAAPMMSHVRKQLLSDDPAVRDLAQARIALGTMMMATIVPFVAEKGADCLNRELCITGSPPADFRRKSFERQAGIQYNSIKIGDKWYSYSRLDPVGQLVGIAADAAQLIKLMYHQGYSEERQSEFAAQLVMAVSNNVVNKTYMQGPAEFFDVFTSFDKGRWERWAQKMAGSAIPRVVAGVERGVHPAWSDAEGVIEEWKSQIPGLSEDLPPVRDFFGHPIKGGYMGPSMTMPALWSPVWKSETNLSPFIKEALRLEYYPSKPNRIVYGAELNNREYDEYMRVFGHALKPPKGTNVLGIDIGGMTLHKALNRVVQQEEYKAMGDSVTPPGGKVKVIRAIVDAYRDMAAIYVLGQFPAVLESAAEVQKQKLLAGGMPEDEAAREAKIMVDTLRQQTANPQFEVTPP